MDHMARAFEVRRKIGSAADNLRAPDEARKGIDAVDAVLKGHDASIRPDQRKNGLRRFLAVIGLHREDYDLDRSDFRRSISGGDARQIDIAERTRHAKAACSHCFKVSAAGNK